LGTIADINFVKTAKAKALSCTGTQFKFATLGEDQETVGLMV